ncbi:MAG TPA: DinB family protein [Candidatus Eremiobacteraceae bacterium]|nr:DinB family protein [Candidatus Eremiobacteraceae bacterium]
MREAILAVVGFWVAICGGAGQAVAQDAQAGQSMPAAAMAADKTSPSYDMKAQAVFDLQDMQKKYVGLAEAIPAEKYAWRPAAGVRSIGELFLHISAANFNIPTMMGATANPATKQKDYEKSMTDKAKIIEQVKQAFANAISVTQAMSNADFAKPEKKLGPDANDGDVIYLMVTHAHEHLGQAIAYARMNGVVPPWTAAAMKKDPKKPQD